MCVFLEDYLRVKNINRDPNSLKGPLIDFDSVGVYFRHISSNEQKHQ